MVNAALCRLVQDRESHQSAGWLRLRSGWETESYQSPGCIQMTAGYNTEKYQSAGQILGGCRLEFGLILDHLHVDIDQSVCLMHL